MEIIEKETVKEVPVDAYGNRVCNTWGYSHERPASRGVAGTGLGLK